MKSPLRFVHSFVEFIPADPEPHHLYISIPYGTAIHLCACGCGNKVVTPISPAEWHLTYDGDSVSLNPSIGNWQFPCRSHYYIRESRIKWEAAWTDKEIAAGRRRDARDREIYFSSRQAQAEVAPPESTQDNSGTRLVRRIRSWFSRP